MLETCHNFEGNMFLKMLQYIHALHGRIQTMYILNYVTLHQSNKNAVNNILIHLSIYTQFLVLLQQKIKLTNENYVRIPSIGSASFTSVARGATSISESICNETMRT